MRILIGVDGSRASEVACHFVAGRTWPAGTRIGLISAFESPVDWTGLAPPVPDAVDAEAEAAELVLEQRAAELRARGWSVDTQFLSGNPAEVLTRAATEQSASLVVVGNRGLGPIASAIIGSVSAHLVDHAPCPVLVVRSTEATRMLLASDGTASSRSIPSVLGAWGHAFRGLPVEVVCVAPSADRTDLTLHEGIAEQVADEMIELGWHAAAIARCGDPGREIVTAGREWGADLIVTGSRGIGTLRRLVAGSVAHDVVLQARSSVLVVRGLVPAPMRDLIATARPAFG